MGVVLGVVLAGLVTCVGCGPAMPTQEEEAIASIKRRSGEGSRLMKKPMWYPTPNHQQTYNNWNQCFSSLRESYPTILIQRSSEDLHFKPTVLPNSS